MKTSRAEETEMGRLREQLLNVFHNQMELRRSLMELNNTTIEITLETTRNQLLIQKSVYFYLPKYHTHYHEKKIIAAQRK